MISFKFYNTHHSPSLLNSSKLHKERTKQPIFHPNMGIHRRKLTVRRCSGQEPEKKKTERRSFLSLEEAGLVELSGLSTHERFLCRLTISSLNLLRVISEEEGYAIEELNAGKVCDWFVKDKVKREQNMESAVLQWDDSEFKF
ncbi:uncharacterized protein LOC110604061 [Manihot esculenta]|uniref:Receptor-interacting protein n=1 Tax=Manihot esculenta TaxID=3983 RepID=A0A2C9U807_MANES|nr:uncharacterized protein LOC110604061 [Manihot esculenta]OAY26082.1 hypothetical protein MANES_16G019900v8 [Manihot esculenta]